MQIKRELNKVVKTHLLEIVKQKNLRVSITGNNDLYVINVKNAKNQSIFAYTHTKNGETIKVGKEIVASSVVASEDMKDVQRALVKRMDEDNKAKQLEIDRKNMRDYDIRAVEFLKQQCNVR